MNRIVLYNLKLGFAVIVVLLLTVCSKENGKENGMKSLNEDPFQDKFFSLMNSHTLADTSFPSYIFDSTTDKNGNLFITDYHGRRILQVNKDFSEFTQIGNRGVGPGEYSTPRYIDITDEILFFSDSNNSLIKSMSINNKTDQYYNVPHIRGAANFSVTDSLILVKGTSSPYMFIYEYGNDEHPSLITKKLDLPDYYHIPNSRQSGGSILTDSNGLIYFIPQTPYRIFVFNKQFELIDEFNGEIFPDVVPWTEEKYNSLMKSTNIQERFEKLQTYTRVLDAKLIMNHDNEYILVELSDIGRGYRVFHLINTKGELIKTYRASAGLISTFKNKLTLIFRYIDKENFITIKEYILR